ncbi:MAG: glycine cleavage system protein R [Lentisphaeria bacterium]|jgi:glycine cleavage system transcriptional repressor
MSTPYIITIMSHDRVGIVADVTHAIRSLQGNLEDMSQTVIRGYFTMILLAQFPDGMSEATLRNAFRDVSSLGDCEIGIKPFIPDADKHADNSSDNLYVLTAAGPDGIGLVDTLAEYLRQKNINIVDLSTKSINGQYTMMFVVSLPENTDVGKLKRSLQIAVEDVGLNVGLRHQALFRAANEI